MNKIIIKNVSKKYGNKFALDNVSVDFKKNKIYGLLGKNGAGKSTLIKAIGNRINLSDGVISVDGNSNLQDLKVLEKLYIMNNASPLLNTKVKKLFKSVKTYLKNFDLDYAYKLADLFELNIDQSTKKLSTGYQTITKFIVAISSNADYIFLDEPTLGLDVIHREYVYKVIMDMNIKKENTIIISTHIIDEVEKILEDVVIINNGKIIIKDNIDNLRTSYYECSGDINSIDAYMKDKEVISSRVMGNLKNICIKGEMPDKEVTNISINSVNLNYIFQALTKEEEDSRYEIFSSL